MLHTFFFHRHLEADEHAVRFIHKHWLLGLKALFRPSAFLLATWGLMLLEPARALLVVGASFTVGFGVWWLRNFFDYFLDVWIVTDHGIIDIAWHGWFHRQAAKVLYSDIQGVSYEIHGVWGTLLRYGTVSVEKISTGTAISLECVGNPRKVESLILKTMEAYLHTKNLKDARHIQEILSDIVATQVQHRQMAHEPAETRR